MKERIILLVSMFLKIFSSVFAGAIITRHYPDNILGTYQQGVLLYSTLFGIMAMGLPKAITFFAKTQDTDMKNIIWHVLSMLLFFILFFTPCVFFLWENICEWFNNPLLQPLFWIVICNTALRSINEIYIPIAVLAKREYYIWNIEFLTAFFLLSIVSVCSYYELPIQSLLAANALLELFRTYFLFDLIHKHCPGTWHGLRWNLCYRLFLYSFPIVGSYILLVLAGKLDSFLISIVMLPEKYAIYSRGALEIPVAKIIIVNIGQLLIPKIVTLYHKGTLHEISKIYRIEMIRAAFIIIPFFFSFFIVHRDFIVLLYTEKYIASADIFAIYLCSLPIQLYSFDLILQAIDKTKTILYISFAGVTINLILGISLIHWLDVLGPAVGTTASTIVVTILYIYFLRRYLKESLLTCLPWKALGIIFLICGSVFCILYYLMNIIVFPLSIFFKITFWFGFSYILQIFLLWQANILPTEDKNRALEILQNLWKKLKKA